MALLEVTNLVKHFPVRGGLFNRIVRQVHAVNGVSFSVEKGEIVGVVGESGCGKSTLGKLIVHLLEATAGDICFQGRNISHLRAAELLPVRRQLQMIFQDPHASLNPRMTVGRAVREVLAFHKIVPRAELTAEVERLFAIVGLHTDAQTKYPHEFSGGQKQRVGIARALAVRPEFIIADEPVSALDVSIQAQVLNLLMELQDEFALTMLFISHDLKVIDHFCDRMLVMYLGFVVEEIPCRDIASAAKHPYTLALLGANPVPDPAQRHELAVLAGEVPSPYDLPPGCPFAARCPLVTAKCRQEMPPLETRAAGHRVACWEV